MTTTDKLPKVPSELLELATRDFDSLDRDHYLPQALSYHRSIPAKQICQVCLARAIMANTIGAPKDEEPTPGDLFQNGTITTNDTRALTAVDYARIGIWTIFLATLDVTPKNTPSYAQILQELRAQPNVHPNFNNWEQLEEHAAYIKGCAQILRSHGH